MRPAYARFEKFLATDYAPKGRTEFGVWSLPDGEARYRFAIHLQTSLDTPPAEIHQLGLNQEPMSRDRLRPWRRRPAIPMQRVLQWLYTLTRN